MAPSRAVSLTRTERFAGSKALVVRVSMRLAERGADIVLGYGGGRGDACVLRLALQVGDDEEGLAGQRIGGVELRAAAIGEQEFAALAPSFRDAVRPGVEEKGAGGGGMIANVALPRFFSLPCQPLRQTPRRLRARAAFGAKPHQPPLEIDAVAAEPALGDEDGKLGGSLGLSCAGSLGDHVRQPRRQRELAHRFAGFRQTAGLVDRAETKEQRPRLGERRCQEEDRGGATSSGRRRRRRRSRAGAPERSACRISGGVKAGSAAVCSARHRRIATPGSVLPARPARWSAEARLTRTVSSRVRPVAGS